MANQLLRMNNWNMLKMSLLALAHGLLQLAALTFGAALGSVQFVQSHTAQCVKQQIEDLSHLVSQPHASYSAFQVASYSWVFIKMDIISLYYPWDC